MNPSTVAQIIQYTLAPVVMVTSSAILIGGMLARYAAVNDRLRALARERLDLLRQPDGSLSLERAQRDTYGKERLREIDTQVPGLMRRHQLIHNALVTTYGALALFITSMFVIAAGLIFHAAAAEVAALVVFLAGTTALLLAVVAITFEVRASANALYYEVQRVMELGH